MKRHTEHVLVGVGVLAAIVIGLGLFVWSGIYNIGADDHHLRVTYRVLQILRDRSIRARADDIQVPNLDDPQLILKGGRQYAAMCAQCHLEPGIGNSELREGMYPQPPNLSQEHFDPRVAFWTIKHGIKMSAMPAWGQSHDDATIWSMVAFMGKLPGMTPEQYKATVAKLPPGEDTDMHADEGHPHSHAVHGRMTTPAPGMTSMPGRTAPPSAGTGSGD
ncbi:MAG TPA: cytochrome c [Gammaproteobacteria bacterium]|nr:cytochrome c [Gammaproteobacteria bacterium]